MPPDSLPQEARWRASLALGFERRGGRTVLADRRHDGPLVVQKALHPEGPEVCHAIVVHPPAGIAGGDELLIDVAVREGAHALLTTPGAGKWYRTSGPWASQQVRIDVATGGIAEWLPQETIVYDGARARITWEAELAHDARLIAWDIFCLGRTAAGERFDAGHCALEARVSRGGHLAWIERGRIEPGSRMAASAAGLDSQPVFGTLIFAAPSIDDAWVAAAREEIPLRGISGVTRLPGLLVARYRGDCAEAARGYFGAIWRRLRMAVVGREAVEPRIWRT